MTEKFDEAVELALENACFFQNGSEENTQNKMSKKLTIFLIVKCSTENADGKESERNQKQPLHLGFHLVCVN